MVVVHVGSKLLMFIDAVGYSTDWVGGGIIVCGSYSCFLMRFATVKNDTVDRPEPILLGTGGVGVLVGKRILVSILVPSVLDESGHLVSNLKAGQLGNDKEGGINAGADTRTGDKLAVLDPASTLDPFDVWT